jgi:hypothetical protein
MNYRRLMLYLSFIWLGPYNFAISETIQGVVYNDLNQNLRRDANEPGITGVLVSNKMAVSQTDQNGRYALDVQEEDIIFVIKPAGYTFPLNENNIPQFYYIHTPEGSPSLKYIGVEATGPLPQQIDFPLYADNIGDAFKIVVFSDPQPRDEKEINYIRDDVVSELIGTSAVCGIVLGDIMYDDLSLYEYYSQVLRQAGIPFYHVPGNHDMNYDAIDDEHSLETYKRNFGPPYYGFQYGKVHFIVLDVVDYLGYNEKGNTHYQGNIGEQQRRWLENYLKFIPQDHLIVLNMHIPLYSFIGEHVSIRVIDRDLLFALLKNRSHLLALAGHMHMIEHQFLGKEQGWFGEQPFHQIICGAVSGSWWNGPPDIRGIPVADQRDGAPNGYHIFTFQGNSFKERYVPAQFGDSHQIRISAPSGTINRSQLDSINIVVNVFDGNEESRVIYQIDNQSSFSMSRQKMVDPFVQGLHENYQQYYLSWIKPRISNHIWTAPVPDDLDTGIHSITVTATNQWGEKFQDSRIFEIK